MLRYTVGFLFYDKPLGVGVIGLYAMARHHGRGVEYTAYFHGLIETFVGNFLEVEPKSAHSSGDCFLAGVLVGVSCVRCALYSARDALPYHSFANAGPVVKRENFSSNDFFPLLVSHGFYKLDELVYYEARATFQFLVRPVVVYKLLSKLYKFFIVVEILMDSRPSRAPVY